MAVSQPQPVALSSHISHLPDEVLCLITSLLSNRDIKNIRLTNKRLRSASVLRIERVFTSPSYKNNEVFRTVAAHEEFSSRGREIIWDDARFEKYTKWLEEGEKPRTREEFDNICGDNLLWVDRGVSGLILLGRVQKHRDRSRDDNSRCHESPARRTTRQFTCHGT